MLELRWWNCEHESIDSGKYGTEEWKPEGWEKGLLKTLTRAWARGLLEIGSKTENQEKPSTGGELALFMNGKCEGLLIKGWNKVHMWTDEVHKGGEDDCW